MTAFIEELFIGGSVKDLGTVVYGLRRRIPVHNVYCIALFLGEKPKVELISSRQLFSKKNEEKDIVIAGIAYGRQEALSLLQFMVQEAAKEGKDLENPLDWSFWEAEV